MWEFLFLSYAIFLKNVYLFVLFIFSCAEFSLVAASGGYSAVAVQGPLVVAASLVGARLQGEWASVVAAHGLRRDPPRHVGSSPTRDRTCVACIARRILNHWTTREAPVPPF